VHQNDIPSHKEFLSKQVRALVQCRSHLIVHYQSKLLQLMMADETQKKENKGTITASKFKIDFSFRREVFFIIAGALVVALTYIIPITVFAISPTTP
jgi:hypothetical protein